MAFGKKESYDESYLSYTENIDMLLNDLQRMGHRHLTKEWLIKILHNNFSIGRAVRMEVCRILDDKVN